MIASGATVISWKAPSLWELGMCIKPVKLSHVLVQVDGQDWHDTVKLIMYSYLTYLYKRD